MHIITFISTVEKKNSEHYWVTRQRINEFVSCLPYVQMQKIILDIINVTEKKNDMDINVTFHVIFTCILGMFQLLPSVTSVQISMNKNNHNWQHFHHRVSHALLSKPNQDTALISFYSQNKVFVPHRVQRLGFDVSHLDVSRGQHFLDAGTLL